MNCDIFPKALTWHNYPRTAKKGEKMPQKCKGYDKWQWTFSHEALRKIEFRLCIQALRTLQPWLKVGISSRHALWMSGLVRSMILIFDGVLYTEHIPLPRFIRDTGNLKNLKNHCTYVRTVSSLSALLNWFKLVYGSFRQSNVKHSLDFCPDQIVGRNQMYHS